MLVSYRRDVDKTSGELIPSFRKRYTYVLITFGFFFNVAYLRRLMFDFLLSVDFCASNSAYSSFQEECRTFR